MRRARDGCVHLREEIEDAVKHFWRNTDAGVALSQPGLTGFSTDGEKNGATGIGVFPGIGEQIGDDLLPTYRFPFQNDRFFPAPPGTHADSAPTSAGERNPPRGERWRLIPRGLCGALILPLADARDIEQVVDEPRHVFDLSAHHIQAAQVRFLLFNVGVAEQIDGHQYRRKRIAQLMSKRG